ncbi:hypothetical protein J5N97_029209 [Dioscorea zingiberensis]|uniref:Uncharacterized protein n=1 Tax=Dioscorea zingiberensis TaxID=325984 RepID=A0A9D5BZU7_9LILI|nr:hypothetical protein J5N97_029209 [Dioscorea zingiberensis]
MQASLSPTPTETKLSILAIAGGGAILVWWALAFHPSNKQLWMVPLGLVLLGTPLVAGFSLLASSACARQPVAGEAVAIDAV